MEKDKYITSPKYSHITDLKSDTLDNNKYEVGGKVVDSKGNSMPDASKGGFASGRSHSENGIKGINKSGNNPIEFEGGEVIITEPAVADTEKREFEGEMLTNREILSKINESGGGVSFADGGQICEVCYSGKTFNYGGETLEDYKIMRRMQEDYDEREISTLYKELLKTF